MGRLKQSTEKIQELLDKVEKNEFVSVDSALSTTSENPVQNKVVTEELSKKVNKTDIATPDWNASEREAGHINGRSHYISGAHAIPFEQWDKRFDEDGDAIYSRFLASESIFGCLIREGSLEVGEINYIFFGTEWKSLSPAVSADIRINYDSESAISVLEIKLYRYGDPEEFLANIINNALFAYGFSKDFIYPIANEFIPDTIARQESVDELREETTALWENLDHGTFPNLTAGDLAGRGESVPASFGFRASGGKSIKDGRAYIKRIKGNSVVWNQKASFNRLFDTLGIAESTDIEGSKMITLTQDYAGSSDYEIRFYYNGQLIAGHVYCVSMETYSSKGGRVNMDYGGSITNRGDIPANTWSLVATIGTAALDKANFNIYPNFKSVGYLAGDTFGVRNVRVIDLTQMFQAGNEPTTIEEFNSRVATLGIDMYAYNEGEVIHCNTESIKSVGDNAWDEQWRLGFYVSGQYIDSPTQICSKNPIQVLPNESYCINQDQYYVWYYDKDMRYIDYAIKFNKESFVTPSNAAYIHFNLEPPYGVTYKNDIIVTLVHSGWKQDTDAGYQPYWQDTLPLPIIKKYFSDGMKKAGAAHDEIRYNKASGKWEYSKGRIKSVDLGDLDWSYYPAADGYPFGFFYASPQGRKYGEKNILCGKYAFGYFANDKSILGNTDGENIYIMDSAYTDAASFKAMLQEKQVKLYYESNDWEWVELDEADQNFRDYYTVADFGTEEAIPATDAEGNIIPSAAFSADIIYQFNAVDMIREHEMEINELQSIIATMQAQLTSLINK